MNEVAPPKVHPRLKFIDLARSLAIILMLEGHFVGLTLVEEARDASYPVYAVWNYIRGFTAPLFFTVAGMVFVYLLAGETTPDFLKRKRVGKGFVRALELLFWGYALQLSVKNFHKYLRGDWGDFDSWVFAFHVLQCIGIGLIALILVAAAHHRFGKFPLKAWYVMAIVICLGFYVWLKSLPEGTYVPEGWPPVIQNAISGPRTVFPVAPWLGFAFLGGAMGAHLRSHSGRPVTNRSCLWLFGLAVALALGSALMFALPLPAHASSGLAWFTGRASEVVAFLGILRLLETRFGIGVPWLLRVGRETFAIYIVHVIVLYSGLFGLGLNQIWKEKLSPWQAAAGAAAFVGVFIIHAQLLNRWKTRSRDRKQAGLSSEKS